MGHRYRAGGGAATRRRYAPRSAQRWKMSDAATAASVRILYGGSVNAKNVGELVDEPTSMGASSVVRQLEPMSSRRCRRSAAGGPLP